MAFSPSPLFLSSLLLTASCTRRNCCLMRVPPCISSSLTQMIFPFPPKLTSTNIRQLASNNQQRSENQQPPLFASFIAAQLAHRQCISPNATLFLPSLYVLRDENSKLLLNGGESRKTSYKSLYIRLWSSRRNAHHRCLLRCFRRVAPRNKLVQGREWPEVSSPRSRNIETGRLHLEFKNFINRTKAHRQLHLQSVARGLSSHFNCLHRLHGCFRWVSPLAMESNDLKCKSLIRGQRFN